MDSMIALEELIENAQREKCSEKSLDLHSSTGDESGNNNNSPRTKNSVDIGDYIMQPTLIFVNPKHEYKNVVFFMQEELEVLKRWSRDQSFMLSFVHGKKKFPYKEVRWNTNV